jgi:hypothetical protein
MKTGMEQLRKKKEVGKVIFWFRLFAFVLVFFFLYTNVSESLYVNSKKMKNSGGTKKVFFDILESGRCSIVYEKTYDATPNEQKYWEGRWF